MPGIGSRAVPKPIRGMHQFTRRKSARERLEAAYEAVNKRDENKSRVSGITLLASAPDPRQRREHHHLRERSLSPAQRADEANIILCSAFEHGLLTSGALLHEGDNAHKRIVFHWDRTKVKVGEEPIRILSKRWSQNK